ncbi:MAG: hypothetical protein FWC79_06010 [Oscillospiraceae bacterium]|nr:hypothetical protein [Oscillospiraceae bacterium]
MKNQKIKKAVRIFVTATLALTVLLTLAITIVLAVVFERVTFTIENQTAEEIVMSIGSIVPESLTPPAIFTAPFGRRVTIRPGETRTVRRFIMPDVPHDVRIDGCPEILFRHAISFEVSEGIFIPSRLRRGFHSIETYGRWVPERRAIGRRGFLSGERERLGLPGVEITVVDDIFAVLVY